MTQCTITNLRLLAAFIEANVEQSQLDMRHFRGDGAESVPYKSEHNCGTTGCALGWSPLIPQMPPLPEHFTHTGRLYFGDYGAHYYPALYELDTWGDLEPNDDWRDVFDGDLSSDKAEVVQRLRSKADELEAID